MDQPVLSVRELHKNYGSLKAVDGLTLDIHKGNIYGILGPNGSGKTTTLGVILQVIRPTSGNFSWFNKPPSKDDRRKIGAILEVPIFYPYLSGEKNLRIITKIKGLPYDGIDDALKTVGLFDRKQSKYKTYSLGMKQRLAIAAALLGDPEVLILDEPTNGLDPQGIAEIRNLIINIGKRGITIILASHILDEVQKICTHVAVLDKGKKLYSGEVSEVLSQSGWLEIAAPKMQDLKIALSHCPMTESVQEEDEFFIVQLKDQHLPEELNQWLFEKGIIARHLAVRKQSLEKYFLDLLDKS